MEYADDIIRKVADEALLQWNVRPAKVALVSRTENVVFRIDAEEGHAYALRVHRPGYHTLAELESEPLWTTALNAAGVGAPVAEKTRTGGHYAAVGVPGTDEVRHVGLIPWFDGVGLDQMIEQAPDATTRDSHFQQLGRLMATMHEQAATWTPPPGFQRHAFDEAGLMGEAPFWGRFWDVPELTSPQRAVLIAARSRLHTRLSEYGKDPRTYSMIHADLRSTNVLVAGDQVHVIDFDDAGFGWHLYDVAVALAEPYALDSDYEPIRDALVEGYRARRALSDEDLALLPQFLVARLLASLGWLHDRPEVDLYALLPTMIEIACGHADALVNNSP